jgi:chromosome segregation ATPase
MFESISQIVVMALESLDSNQVTGLFVLLMIVLFALALTATLTRRAAAFQQSTPTLLTTLGILGTFLGIAIGLLDFDSSRIEYSIPLLLEGLKLAFITSIVGILLATALRLTQVLKRDGVTSTGGRTNAAATLDTSDPAALFKLQIQLADAQLTATRQLGEQLVRMDARLIQTLEQQHDAQLAAFRDFAGQLSELGSRQLMAALESVIRDFNDKLGAQFGENFRHLDASIGRLLDWQVQYREHMDALGAHLELAVAGVERSQTSLQTLTQQAGQITTQVEDQQSTMQALKRETLELESVLGGVAELRERAKDAFPAIDQRLRTMLETIEGAVLSGLEAQQRIGRLGTATSPPPAARFGANGNHLDLARASA